MWAALPCQQNHLRNHFEMVKGAFCLVLKVHMCILFSIEVRGSLSNSATNSQSKLNHIFYLVFFSSFPIALFNAIIIVRVQNLLCTLIRIELW
jgi:hypothetical protein